MEIQHQDDCDCHDCDLRHDRSINERKAAQYLGLSQYTLQKWRWQGRPPAFEKTGRAVRYRARDLRDFRDGLRKRSTSDVDGIRGNNDSAASKPQLSTAVVAYLPARQADFSNHPNGALAAAVAEGMRPAAFGAPNEMPTHDASAIRLIRGE